MAHAYVDWSSPTADPTNPYRRPDPATVAYIYDEYGVEAALERWPSIPKGSLQKIVATGRKLAKKVAA